MATEGQGVLHRIPGEYEYKGVTLSGFINKTVLDNPHKVFECRESDIYIATYPRSGTTWSCEMTSLIQNGCSIEENLSTPLWKRVPFFEYKDGAKEMLGKIESPRLIKTHLPYELFPIEALRKKCKIIYIGRNPKDAAVSYFKFYQAYEMFGPFIGSWNDFFSMFLNSQVSFGSWFDHVLGWWHQKNSSCNILYLKYEDMIKDLKAAIRKIAEFIGKDLDEETVSKIAEHCSFNSMEKNPAVVIPEKSTGPFIRKGIIGDWKNYFTVKQSEDFNQLYKEKMKDCPFSFEEYL